ncbi:hypothetical protein FS749_013182 [Ceratobasidium sp. UAMH 11750]|nr:hypothetical protein FS749_013182 [Ceratobasidium sp. UAMH 11750]
MFDHIGNKISSAITYINSGSARDTPPAAPNFDWGPDFDWNPNFDWSTMSTDATMVSAMSDPTVTEMVAVQDNIGLTYDTPTRPMPSLPYNPFAVTYASPAPSQAYSESTYGISSYAPSAPYAPSTPYSPSTPY